MKVLVTHSYVHVLIILVLCISTSWQQLILVANADEISPSQTESLVVADRNLQNVGSVFQVVIIDAITGQVVGPVTNGMTIFLSTYNMSGPNSLNFVANTTGNVRSVKLTATGDSAISRIENESPFALCSNDKSNFLKCKKLNLGLMALTAQPFSSQDGRGRAGTKFIVRFEIAQLARATNPTKIPTQVPTKSPTRKPTTAPVRIPTKFPTRVPTKSPTRNPTTAPVRIPTKFPTRVPTKSPTRNPTTAPVRIPTKFPTRVPTKSPTRNPTTAPARIPTKLPTKAPTKSPTRDPTTAPARIPTKFPTVVPTKSPTRNPTTAPARTPTRFPTRNPTTSPTQAPTTAPARNPTQFPTRAPTKSPTRNPTTAPARIPTKFPTMVPTKSPTRNPTTAPARTPTRFPTRNPTTAPTQAPTTAPARNPTNFPTRNPTTVPTQAPTTAPARNPTSFPTRAPTKSPTGNPTKSPTRTPTKSPTTVPSKFPTRVPTKSPTRIPTMAPTRIPTKSPTRKPTLSPVQTISAYDVELFLFGTVDVDDAATFQEAANTWKQVIVADLPNRTYTGQTLLAGCNPPSSGSIDDLYICAKIEPIDGPLKVLGLAGPTWIRGVSTNSGRLPFIGSMVVDSADVPLMKSTNIYKPVILHEMGHVLGIGTLWERLGVTGTEAENCPYRGVNGNNEYVTLSGCTGRTLPTEQSGGAGTRCDHFSEECFIHELMTGKATPNRVLPLSRLTIATLQDLGYTVTYANAQPYTSASMNSSCVCNRRERNLHGKQLKVVKSVDTPGLDSSTGSTTPWKRRKLSDEGYRSAYEFGQSILLQRRQQFAAVYENLTTNATSSEKMQSEYIGAKIVNVLYHDGVNGIFEVMVYG